MSPAHRVWRGDDEHDWAGYDLDLSRWPEPHPILVSTPTHPDELFLEDGEHGPQGVYRVSDQTASGVVEDVAPVRYLPEAYAGDGIVFGGDLDADGDLDVVAQSVQMFISPPIPRPEMHVYDASRSGDVLLDAAWARFMGDTEHGGPIEPCGAGDLDGDGHDDLPIGMTVGNESTQSRLPIFLGPLAPGDHSVPDGGDVTLTGGADEELGRAMACGADLNGDGLNDLLVGSMERTEGDGGVWLISGLSRGEFAVADLGLPLWTGEPGGGKAGQSQAMDGDLDGDGRHDAFIGAPQWDGTSGRGYVVTDAAGGPLAEAYLRVDSLTPSGWMGMDAAIGDLDGDGNDDLAVGAPGNVYAGFGAPGTVAVFAGPVAPGIVDERDAAWVVVGGHGPDGFGVSVEVEDVNADGVDDLAVGAPFDSKHVPEAGATYLFLGGVPPFR